ncbi:MAG: DUF1795 domain-containing protein, partial [Candidatus Omnitrophica bacterium]|nr:DUF1795 domain-containing protein [Candidatus Omnitrophota bacterium]
MSLNVRSACVWVALITVFLSSGPSLAQEKKHYINRPLGFKLEYPADYSVKTIGSAIVFSSSAADKTFAFSPSINIVVVDLGSEPQDLDTFYTQSKEALERSFGGVKFIEDKKDKLDGVNAYRLEYKSRQKKADFKFLQVMCIRKTKAYVLTYTALQEQY